MELNAEAVREAREQGERIVYGDATRKEVLHHVRLEHARILVLAISDPDRNAPYSLARAANES